MGFTDTTRSVHFPKSPGTRRSYQTRYRHRHRPGGRLRVCYLWPQPSPTLSDPSSLRSGRLPRTPIHSQHHYHRLNHSGWSPGDLLTIHGSTTWPDPLRDQRSDTRDRTSPLPVLVRPTRIGVRGTRRDERKESLRSDRRMVKLQIFVWNFEKTGRKDQQESSSNQVYVSNW